MYRLLSHRLLGPLLLVIVFPCLTLAQSADDQAARAEAARLTAEAVALYNSGELAQAEPLLKQALVVLERAFGAEHPEVATSLHNLAALYYAQGRYAKAEALHTRVLAIREQTLGAEHPSVGSSLTNLAMVYGAQGRYAEAEPLQQRALTIQEQALGASHPAVAITLNSLAVIYQEQGRYTEAEPLYQRALAIDEQTLGPDHPTVAIRLNNLAALYDSQGRYAQAEPLYQRALAIREQALGPEHPEVAASLNNLAFLYHSQGRYAQAESLYQRALAIDEQALGPTHPTVAIRLNNLAALYDSQGLYTQAEPLYQRALVIRQQALGAVHPAVAQSLNNLALLYDTQGQVARAEPLYRRALAIWEQTLGPVHPTVAQSLNNLAELSRLQGRYDEAEALHQRALAIREQVLRPMHPAIALSLNNLAGLYEARGRLAQVEPLYQRALAIYEQALGAEHPNVATSLNNLASFYRGQERYAEAEPLYQRALRIQEQALGADHPDVAVSLNNLAVCYRAQGRDAQAEPLYRHALAIVEQALGPEHPLAARSLNNLANLLEQSQPSHAHQLYQRARRIFLRVAQVNTDLHDEALRGLLRESQQALQANMAFLARLARQSQSPPKPIAPAWEAFEVAEQLRSGAAHLALAQAGARAATASPSTAQLARQVQDMRQRRQAVRMQLTAEYGKSAPQHNATRVAQLQQDERQLDDALAAATQRLRTAFPEYAALVMPEPIKLTAVTTLIQPHEALVSFFTLPDRLLVWLVRPDQQPVYRDIDVTKAALEGMEHRVRVSLDQGSNPALAAGQVLPFDVEGAHALYTLLLAPLREHLAGVTHLLIVPDEILLPLPFGVLVTQAEGEAYQTLADLYRNQLAPAPGELLDYARIAWLARDYTITVLPAATSLRALRRLEHVKVAAMEPFIGFGDPLLQGTGIQRGGSMLASRGTAVALDAIQRLNRLPATRAELLAVATALGADPHDTLYLDTQATETQVRALNSTGRLGQARVLAFATHGLLSGEVTGLTQPALVLTPPIAPNDQDDGLLSLDDILELKLSHTDWVILSACNTGAADRSGEGLSGLTRAFFFAGVQALLVSHWSVDDRATQALMTAVFRHQANTPTLAPAAALQQGMLALLAQADGDTAYFAHPYAWAPFFLVGEGR